MSPMPIAPVMSRIQTIETRFGVPADRRIVQPGTSGDFASQLSAAFADSSLLAGSTGTDPTGATVASSAIAPPWSASAWSAPTSLVPGTYATLTSSLDGITPAPPAGTATLDGSSPFATHFEAAGNRHGVPPELLSAVGWVESRYQVDAVSSAGAEGVMQLMPFVSAELGVDPYDPPQAIDGAARLLRSHFDRFGSWDLALAAYNAGAGAVSRAGNSIPSSRVADYVQRVNERMAS